MRSTLLVMSGLSLVGTATLVGHGAAHADSGSTTLGSWSLTATAPGFEATEDEPAAQAHPEGQGAVPESSMVLTNGPVGYALSSVAWPGATAGSAGDLVDLLFPHQIGGTVPVPDAITGLVDQNHTIANWPLRAEARTGSHPDGALAASPAMTLKAHADAARVDALGTVAGAAQQGAFSVGPTSTESTGTVDANVGKAVATETITNIDLGGVVKIGQVTSTATATSNGQTASGSGKTVVSNMTIAGQPAYVDETGVHIGSGPGVPVNATVSKIANQALAGFGMKFYVSQPQTLVKGNSASYTAGSLIAVWTPPGDSSNNVFVVTLGGARVTAAASPGFSLPSLVPPAVGGATGEVSGASEVGGGNAAAGPSFAAPSGAAGAAASSGTAGSYGGAGASIGSAAGSASSAGASETAVGQLAVATGHHHGIGGWQVLIGLVGVVLLFAGSRRLAGDLLYGVPVSACQLEET